MFEQQKQQLAKLQARVSVLQTLNDAFQTALDASEPHTCTALRQWRMPLIDHINGLRAQETNLLRIIGGENDK